MMLDRREKLALEHVEGVGDDDADREGSPQDHRSGDMVLDVAPSLTMAMTLARISSRTYSLLLITLETVEGDTPASLAMSLMLVILFPAYSVRAPGPWIRKV